MDEQTHVPNAMELPSTRQLNRATLIAAVVASVILVTTILPAEYGIDPTGVGSVLGLTPMGEMKRQQANADVEGTAAATAETGDILMDEQTSPASASSSATSAGAGSVTLTLAPNAGTEVKATDRSAAIVRSREYVTAVYMHVCHPDGSLNREGAAERLGYRSVEGEDRTYRLSSPEAIFERLER